MAKRKIYTAWQIAAKLNVKAYRVRYVIKKLGLIPCERIKGIGPRSKAYSHPQVQLIQRELKRVKKYKERAQDGG